MFIFGVFRTFLPRSGMTTPRPGAGCRFSIEYGLECRKPWFPMGLSQSERLGDRPCCFFSGPPVGKELLEIVVSSPRGRQELSVSQFITGFRIRKKSVDIRFPLREERSHFLIPMAVGVYRFRVHYQLRGLRPNVLSITGNLTKWVKKILAVQSRASA